VHLAPGDTELDVTGSVGVLEERSNLKFLWLELTNRCNLQCVHCYSESSPHSGERDLLTTQDYESIMSQAYALGCRMIQFIGGEPQLHPDFLHLLIKAKTIGFEFIEVFTNLTRLRDDTLRYAADNGIRFATSVYSDESAAHEAITKVRGSHARTIKNLTKLISNGIETRTATVVINQDKPAVERTKRFLLDLGVPHVKASEVREFGRGEEILSQRARLSGLCGHCWSGKLCVAPDGAAYPCVMARQWPVGNVIDTPLAEIIRGESLETMRKIIFETVWLPKTARRGNVMAPEDSTPDSPNVPGEEPGTGEPYEPKPAEEPGECEPEPIVICDPTHCDPTGTCPQTPSCEPHIPGCPQSPGPGCPQSPA
jgi:MoaA/NifB/PqqE/SkfB family radical SAM enzyme